MARVETRPPAKAKAAMKPKTAAKQKAPAKPSTKTYTLLKTAERVRPRAKAGAKVDAPGHDAPPFWKTKTLKQMTDAEWESLCDGCGKCCLVKLEDEETLELYFTSLHCKLLNPAACQCSDYANRKKYVPECVKLTPETIPTLDWLPATCAYKLVHEGQDLKDWHHLVCGDPNEVHRRGISAKGKIRSEVGVADEDALDYLIDWVHGPRPKRRRRK
jgi:uncharacterized cysteine cluster protein YcgN (CxxCxxCC family)